MKTWICSSICLFCSVLFADDLSQFESRTGFKGTYNEAEKVFKVSFPRTDVKVSVNGFPLDPFMGLTSWAAFSPINDSNVAVTGDLVLFEDEVNPVMSILLETTKPIESIFGMQGQTKAGMIKFVIGRKVKMSGVEFGKEMGINTWAAFGGTNENAVVDGDFALTEEELQPVLRILRSGNINIVAIHSHMIMESPRFIFLHFWGQGNAEELAKTIKKALESNKKK